jgi:hypothetical protein
MRKRSLVVLVAALVAVSSLIAGAASPVAGGASTAGAEVFVLSSDPPAAQIGANPLAVGVDDEGSPSDPVPLDDWFAPHADTFLGNCKFIVYIANVNNVNQGNITIKEG